MNEKQPLDDIPQVEPIEDRNDLEKITMTLEIPKPFEVAKTTGTSVDHKETSQTVEEIAGDTVELLRRVRGVETRLDQIDQLLRGLFQQLDKTRQDLMGEQKAFAQRSVFMPVVLTLDSLEGMEAGVDPIANEVLYTQLTSVNGALRSILQNFGVDQFRADVGAPFDPALMELRGYADGTPETVVRCVQPGYRAKNLICRKAGVLTGCPRTERNELTSPTAPTEETT